MIVFAYTIDALTKKINIAPFTWFTYISLYALVAGVYYFMSPISFGMQGPSDDYRYLNLLDSWRISNPLP
ncbi:unnamed protein product [Ambrosiozyma monospora]|uniref:Unnamed protein product n=1 Tax=Ambrosiozyma monospora TaxID=43982 RepID=A0ACB5SRH1_AMBMO|nr:unnamed protein product [Ambrosiozyma monospora]